MLKGGVPSHDTFGDIFAVIEPEAISEVFTEWTETYDKKSTERLLELTEKLCAQAGMCLRIRKRCIW